MQRQKPEKGVERPIRTALIVRPIIPEDARFALTELVVRRGDAGGGYELVLPDESRISGPGLTIYGPHALDADALCQDLVEELLTRSFDGETGAVLAMGQTGSGKSRLMGTECRARGAGGAATPWANSVGQYVPRRIFELAAQRQLESFEVECAMVEVYSQRHHDAVRDLLAMGRPQIDRPAAPLKHVTWFPAPDALELQSKLLEGSEARETGRTLGNSRSSRSHAIFMIRTTLTRREGASGTLQKVTAQLMLVDLAGSEQAALAEAGSTTFREGAGINLGLLSLGGVIEDLARGTPPQYTNCDLTRILKPALGGNANAVIVGCISPLVAHLEYTKRTLLYLSKAGTIKNTVKADVRAIRRIEEAHQAELSQLRAQLEALRLAKAEASTDTVVLSRAEYQRLVQQAESERLRADSLDTMLRHITARLVAGAEAQQGPLPVGTGAAAAGGEGGGRCTGSMMGAGSDARGRSAERAAAEGAEGAAGDVLSESRAGEAAEVAPAQEEVPAEQSSICPAVGPAAAASGPDSTGSTWGQPPRAASPTVAAADAAILLHHVAALASPVLTEGTVAAAGKAVEEWEEAEEGAAVAAAGEEGGGLTAGEACLEWESNLQPEQLDLLKLSLDQEQRSMRRKRAQQAQQQFEQVLGANPCSPAAAATTPVNAAAEGAAAAAAPGVLAPSLAARDVRSWARRVAEERTAAHSSAAYSIDSLHHELRYLRQRLNSRLHALPSSPLGAGPSSTGAGSDAAPSAAAAAATVASAAAAAEQFQLEAELAAVEEQLAAAQQAQREAEAGLRADPGGLLGWLGEGPGAERARQAAAALLAELIDSRLHARQLERQLFHHRVTLSSLELALRAYNRCLGEVEGELVDASAEIQVLRMEREEFTQAIEEKMRYVQQAAAAQNALEVLQAQIGTLEKELAAAKEVQQHPHHTPPRSFTSAIMAWTSLGRSPAAASAGAGSHGGHASPLHSQESSVTGSPRASYSGGAGATLFQSPSPLGSLSSSPTRRTFPGSPRGSIGNGGNPAAPAHPSAGSASRVGAGGRASEGAAARGSLVDPAGEYMAQLLQQQQQLLLRQQHGLD